MTLSDMQLIESIVIILAAVILVFYFIYLCFNAYLIKLSETLALREAAREQSIL